MFDSRNRILIYSGFDNEAMLTKNKILAMDNRFLAEKSTRHQELRHMLSLLSAFLSVLAFCP